jgi:dopamine beta-monooxygenase
MSFIPLLFSLVFCVSGLSFDTSAYKNHQQLNTGPDYDIYWTLDNDVIHLAIQVETTGWFGFGLAEPYSGSMLGADIVTVFVGEDLESSTVTDRAVGNSHVLPHADSCQDWVLVNVASENGYSFAELVRFIETEDTTNDRPILVSPLPQNIIFAWGEDGDEEVAYHELRRGKGLVAWDPSIEIQYNIPADAREIRLQIDVEVPPLETAYRCFAFHIPELTGVPSGPSNGIQVIKASPIVDHEDVLHHFLVRRCSAPEDYWQYYVDNFGADCLENMPWQEISAFTSCKEAVYTWGIGQPEFTFPDEVGLRANDLEWIVIEAHFANPNGILYPTPDRSALVFTITETPRQYDAGLTILADPSLSLPPIPIGLISHSRMTTCPGECTIQFPGEVTIFALMIHMHVWATGGSFAVYRNGEFYREIFDTDFYNLHHQNVWHVQPYYVMQPGDDLVFTCKYDTRGATVPVTMGESTLNEMCTPVIYWYPKTSTPDPEYPLATGMPGCGYYSPDATICGTGGLPVANPKNPGPETARLAAKTRGFSSIQPSTCAEVPGASGVLQFNIVLLLVTLVARIFN